MEYELVKQEELPASFQQRAADGDKQRPSESMAIPAAFVRECIVFAVPDTPLGRDYIAWANQQLVGKNENEFVKPVLQDLRHYVAMYGPDSLRLFNKAMKEGGAPYQPVRLVRDSRDQGPLSLSDSATHSYIADP